MMGDMLTFHQSKSTEYVWSTQREYTYPDENFAREVMQLFTIGTKKLNADGTSILDSNGKEIPVYSNANIVELSRAWTGFGKCLPSVFLEVSASSFLRLWNKHIVFTTPYISDRQSIRGNIELQDDLTNSIDPMRIRIEWRDRYPKLGLDDQFVGDHVMLCIDLPKQAFLRKGAKYKLLGGSVSQSQHPVKDNKGQVVVHELSPQSNLATALCKEIDGRCTYPSVVDLNHNIDCVQTECDYETLQVVSVNNILYEYYSPPCVNFSFFNYGKVVSKRNDNGSLSNSGCFDHRGERIFKHLVFSTQQCNVIAIVDTDGKISVLQEDNQISYDSITYFHVNWLGNDEYPNLLRNDCGDSYCEAVGDRCRCSVWVKEEAKFTDTPSLMDVKSSLSVGGVTTAMIDYVSSITTVDGLTIHFKSDSNIYNKDTVFEFIDEYGRVRFLKNQQSIVHLLSSNGATSEQYRFRNPPLFYNPVPELR